MTMLGSAIKIKNCWHFYRRRPFTNPETFKSSGFLIYWMALIIFRFAVWKKVVQACFQPLKLPDFEDERGWRRLSWWFASVFNKSSESSLWITYMVNESVGLRVVKNFFRLSYANFATINASPFVEIVVGCLNGFGNFIARSSELKKGSEAWENRSNVRRRLRVIPNTIAQARRAIVENRACVKRPFMAVLFLWATTSLDANIWLTLEKYKPSKRWSWRWFIPNLLIKLYGLSARRLVLKSFEFPKTVDDITAQWIGQFSLLLAGIFPVTEKRHLYKRYSISFGEWDVILTKGSLDDACDFYVTDPNWGSHLLNDAWVCQVNLHDAQQFIRDEAEERSGELMAHVTEVSSAIVDAISKGEAKRSFVAKKIVRLVEKKGLLLS